MNIYAKRGTKVVFAYPTAGYDPDQEQAKTYLEVGKTYTVERTEVHSWITYVYLMEVPGQRFNSVMFDEKEDKNCQHVHPVLLRGFLGKGTL